jgi:branched-chain amino acid transport system substrate-binding protein
MLCVAAFFCTLLIFSGCEKKESQSVQSLAEEEKVIKIGVMLPLTGSNTQQGVETQFLLKLFERAINETDIGINLPLHNMAGLPNLGGAKVKFILGDCSTVDIAMADAERLITVEKVIGIGGAFSSASTKTAMVPVEKYGVILLSEGTSESLAEANYKYFGRTYPGDDFFIRTTFDYLKFLNEKKGAGIKNIALVCEDSEFGANIAKVERKYAKEYNFNIIEDIFYSATTSNVTSEVLRLKRANADAVIMSSYIADALLFMSTFKEQNYMPKMIFGQRGGFMSSDFLMNLKSDSDYVFTTSRWNYDFKQSDFKGSRGTLQKGIFRRY